MTFFLTAMVLIFFVVWSSRIHANVVEARGSLMNTLTSNNTPYTG